MTARWGLHRHLSSGGTARNLLSHHLADVDGDPNAEPGFNIFEVNGVKGAVGTPTTDPRSAERMEVGNPLGALETFVGEEGESVEEYNPNAAGYAVVGTSVNVPTALTIGQRDRQACREQPSSGGQVAGCDPADSSTWINDPDDIKREAMVSFKLEQVAKFRIFVGGKSSVSGPNQRGYCMEFKQGDFEISCPPFAPNPPYVPPPSPPGPVPPPPSPPPPSFPPPSPPPP